MVDIANIVTSECNSSIIYKETPFCRHLWESNSSTNQLSFNIMIF